MDSKLELHIRGGVLQVMCKDISIVRCLYLCNVLLSIPRILFALPAIEFICVDHDRSDDMITPRSLSESTASNSKRFPPESVIIFYFLIVFTIV